MTGAARAYWTLREARKGIPRHEEADPRQRRPGRNPGRCTRGKRSTSRGKKDGGGRRKKAAPGDDWKVAELYVERRGKRSIVGNIYKGKVDNVLPGMEAAFVDFGLERNGFLHVDEIVTPDGKAAPKRGRGRGRSIAELIKPGQEIVVQVVKDPLKTKGARLSMQLSIAGRYLVYMPQGGGIGVSKRLPDKERTRLRKLIENVDIGGGGVIVRTAAQGAKKEDFVRETAVPAPPRTRWWMSAPRSPRSAR